MRKKFTFLDLPPLEVITDKMEGKSRYYHLPDGTKFPSITTVLGHFNKKHIQEWRERVGEKEANRQSNMASTHGTKVHNSLDRILKNESNIITESKNNPLLQSALVDLRPHIELIDNIHHMEAALYSRRLGVAGRVDLIAEYRGVPVIIDFKTSKKKKKTEWIQHYFEQATAYSYMYQDMTGIQIEFIMIMMSSPEGPQVWIKKRDNYVDSLVEKIHKYKLDMGW